MAAIVGLLAETQHEALVLLNEVLGCSTEGLTVAARMAKRRRFVSSASAKRLERLDIAAHVSRHSTHQKMSLILQQLRADIAGHRAEGGLNHGPVTQEEEADTSSAAAADDDKAKYEECFFPEHCDLPEQVGTVFRECLVMDDVDEAGGNFQNPLPEVGDNAAAGEQEERESLDSHRTGESTAAVSSSPSLEVLSATMSSSCSFGEASSRECSASQETGSTCAPTTSATRAPGTGMAWANFTTDLKAKIFSEALKAKGSQDADGGGKDKPAAGMLKERESTDSHRTGESIAAGSSSPSLEVLSATPSVLSIIEEPSPRACSASQGSGSTCASTTSSTSATLWYPESGPGTGRETAEDTRIVRGGPRPRTQKARAAQGFRLKVFAIAPRRNGLAKPWLECFEGDLSSAGGQVGRPAATCVADWLPAGATAALQHKGLWRTLLRGGIGKGWSRGPGDADFGQCAVAWLSRLGRGWGY